MKKKTKKKRYVWSAYLLSSSSPENWEVLPWDVQFYTDGMHCAILYSQRAVTKSNETWIKVGCAYNTFKCLQFGGLEMVCVGNMVAVSTNQ
jgi:hypothetical protein